MRAARKSYAWVFALAAVAGAGLALAQQTAPLPVALAELDGSVNPGSADHLVRAIAEAEQLGVAALVIRIDTPGGMVDATRRIVKAELAARVPIIVWVGPAGARAGSAGVFVALASHLSAMAPATNIGAAHPVAVGPGGAQSQDETMEAKTTNDLAAWARAIANQRGRNGDWAAEAVTKSVSIPAEEAVEKRVAELIAADLPALLEAADGRTVQTAGGTVVLRTRGARIEPIPASSRERLLNALGDPNIAFLLIGLGILGLLAELSAPGTLVPGIVGAISLALGLLATRMLPVRAGAVVLMILGGVLLAAELFVTSWGLLALAGMVCLGLGGFLLIDPSGPGFLVDRGFGVALSLVLPVMIVVAAILALVVWKIIQSRATPESTGAFGLAGEQGTVVEEVGPERGKIFVHGELWEARARQAIPKGTRVRVEGVRGLVVDVVPVEPPRVG